VTSEQKATGACASQREAKKKAATNDLLNRLSPNKSDFSYDDPTRVQANDIEETVICCKSKLLLPYTTFRVFSSFL
jgi:hypothetical protein